ncbi:MAG: DUF4080 domain-containing protein [bacterium]
MAEIILTTQNAKYIHAAFGLRYLLANLGGLKDAATIREHTIQERPVDVAEALLAEDPRVVGIGVYLWNVRPATELVRLLKRIRPDVSVVIGGPEVSHELDAQEITRLADVVITGEGELAFREVCETLLAGGNPPRIVHADPPALEELALPYELYDDEDIAQRMIYVESSRGCPYRCRFCLSALDHRVRRFPLDRIRPALERLLGRGVRHFKFVDRSLHLGHGQAVLELFLDHLEQSPLIHFELVPDRLPDRLRPLIARFPPGTLQLEAGVQTFDPRVAERIGRRQDVDAVSETLAFLATTNAHVHADLIVGLPGESMEQFAAGFDRLLALGPQEIQVGVLKRLRGTPLAEQGDALGLVFHPEPPYEALQTPDVDFASMQRLKRFAHTWDRLGNSGNFRRSVALLWRNGSPFTEVMRFSDWLTAQAGRTHAIALKRLTDFLHRYLTDVLGQDPAAVGPLLLADYQRGGRRDRPRSLEGVDGHPPSESDRNASAMPRQSRHLK